MGRVKLGAMKYNISDILRKRGLGDYTAAQGYTIGEGDMNVAISLMKRGDNPDEDDRKAVILGLSGDKQYITWDLKLKHANGCAYYDGKYFIAPAGDGSNIVVPAYKWNESLSKWVEDSRYTYIPMTSKDIPVKALSKVSNIAYISGENFILGEGLKISVCKLDKAKKQFQEFSRFTLDTSDKSKLVRGDLKRISQGVYYKDKKLYKVFSYGREHSDGTVGPITMNDVAVFDLKGKTPSFNGTKLNASYTCDDSSKDAFELEDIAEAPDGKMYVSANVVIDEANKPPQQDAIYRITLV